MKRLMILGAGISQLPLIQTAKAMGCYTIVVSRQGKYPGFVWADKVYYEDTTDMDQVAQIAQLERIDGICTTGTDVAVKSIGKAVDALGLCGLSLDSAMLSSNKWEMKQAFMEYGVRTAAFTKVRSMEEAYRALDTLTPPLMFKSVDNGASKGIVRVDDASQVEYAYEIVMKSTRLDFFVVEEFIEGTEFGAQAFVHDHRIGFIMPHGDMMFYGDAGVPIGHYVPYELPEDVRDDLHVQLERGIRALKLNNCAINADFIMKDRKIYVLEIGGRAGATCLPELVSTYYGFNYYEQIVKSALNMNPEFLMRSMQPSACELLISDTDGVIVHLDKGNADDDDIIQISFDYEIGDTVNAFKVGTDRVGQIIVKGNTLKETLCRLEEVKEKIQIELRGGDSYSV